MELQGVSVIGYVSVEKEAYAPVGSWNHISPESCTTWT